MAPPEEDGPVVDAFRAGDEAALTTLYARWSPLVHSLALRSLGDVARAEEVTRRVFTRAWRTRETLDPARTRFSGWLLGLARAEVADASARPTTSAGRRNVDDSTGRESKVGVLAEQLVVADGLSHLDTVSQGVLRMALEHDLTLPEISERTGLPVEEVRSLVAGSLTELRRRLEVPSDAH